MHKISFYSICTVCLSAICLSVLFASGAIKTVNPAYYSGKGLPGLSQMTRVSVDPKEAKGDGYLDIVAGYFCFSDTKFYVAIQTRDGKFPSSGKLGNAWYSYMAVIGNPNDNKTIWALTYMNVPMAGYNPALYRIDVKKSSSLIRIGNIDYRKDKASNALIMSCDISSLLADPQFAAWYSVKNPLFGLVCLINKTTLIPYKTSSQDTTDPGVNIAPRK